MKKILFLVLIFAVFFLIIIYRNNSNLGLIISNLAKSKDIAPGQLKYQMNFLNIFPIGNVIFDREYRQDYQGKTVYYLKAAAETSKLISVFFKASAIIDSYVSIEDNNPVFFSQKLKIQGKPDVDKEVFYNQTEGVMTIAGVKRSILPNTQDGLSALYNLRQMDFDRLRQIEININTNQKNYILQAKVSPKEISYKRKQYRIFHLSAEIRRRDKDNPYHRTAVKMDLLNINNHENIPIFIRIFSSGALITAKLVEIK